MRLSHPKRLVEVDLPIREISAHARKENASKRGGHLSSLHIWWARRPLAACRALLCACLWPDPADEHCPAAFREAAASLMSRFALRVRGEKDLARLCVAHWSDWTKVEPQTLDHRDPATWMDIRRALLDFIGDFASFRASTNESFLDTARELTRAAHAALGGERGSERPIVLDPFAGGGAIPLEALRIGADALAQDLNPVAVLIERLGLDYVQRFRDSLVEEVRRWGHFVKADLVAQLAPFYPADQDGAEPIAYSWARTIRCEGPSCGVEVPILLKTSLSEKSGHKVGVLIRYVSGQLLTEVVEGPAARTCGPGTNRRSSVTCPNCGFTTPRKAVERQANGRGFGVRLLAICLRHGGTARYYRQPTRDDLIAIESARIAVEAVCKEEIDGMPLVPREELPYLRSIFNVRVYGIDRWSKLFNERQLLSATALVRAVRRAQSAMRGAIADDSLRRAVTTSLALAASNTLQYLTTITTYPTERAGFISAFIQGQSLPMKMDFVEVNPLVDGLAGGFAFTLDQHLAGLEYLASCSCMPASVAHASALTRRVPDGFCDLIATDPPYYDMIPYADCSDFFYVWLRRMLPDPREDLGAGLVDKAEEIVQLAERSEQYRHKTKGWFEARMREALSNARQALRADGLAAIVFAHKDTAAWEALLQSILDAGWVITASWPIDTENPNRMRASDSAVLSSSIHLVCRPRQTPSAAIGEHDVAEWRDVLRELPKRMHEWMPRLAGEGIVGADAIFACLGPALEIFSQYSRVEKASGDLVTLKEYLEHVWAAVAREALGMIFAGAETSEFEEDARLTAMWLWTLSTSGDGTGAVTREEGDDDSGEAENEAAATQAKPKGFVLEYDAARKIAQGLGAHLEDLANLVDVKGDTARLLPVAERTRALFGKVDEKAPTGRRKKKDKQMRLGFAAELEEAEEAGGWGEKGAPEKGITVLDRVHQSMILFAASRGEALRRFLVDDGVGSDQRFWRLAQAFAALYPSGTDERRWVEGVLARKKGLGL